MQCARCRAAGPGAQCGQCGRRWRGRLSWYERSVFIVILSMLAIVAGLMWVDGPRHHVPTAILGLLVGFCGWMAVEYEGR